MQCTRVSNTFMEKGKGIKKLLKDEIKTRKSWPKRHTEMAAVEQPDNLVYVS